MTPSKKNDSSAIFLTVPQAIDHFKRGIPLIVVDDEDRENEGDFILPAEKVTREYLNLFLSEGRGVLCVAMQKTDAARFGLSMMVNDNTSLHGTPFTISVDYLKGTTTGVSLADRIATIRALTNDDSVAGDFGKPGHIFPLVASEHGVLQRSGHTEAAVDVCRLAGLKPFAVLIEILNADGTMARVPQLKEIARLHGFGIMTIRSLIEYRFAQESLVRKAVKTKLPTQYGEYQLLLYKTVYNGEEHLALLKGNPDPQKPILARIHSECLTGNVFGSKRCDCSEQLQGAMKKIESAQEGIILFLRQEGRGIGLLHKLKAYELQEHGLDTVEANVALGFPSDVRDYAVAAQMLKDMNFHQVRLLTNNPNKIAGLEKYGIQVTERVPLEIPPNSDNASYLKIKKSKMGHLLSNI